MEALEEEGIATPQALQTQPELFPHLALVWDAFFDASNARQIGGFGGVGGIPPSAIEAELRRFRIDNWEDQEEFRMYLRVLDSEYLQYHSEQQSKSK